LKIEIEKMKDTINKYQTVVVEKLGAFR